MPTPLRPVGRTDLPAPPIVGRYKVERDDFVVEEVPLYEPSGEGTHSWVWIEKRGVSTMQAVERLASALGRRSKEIGYAGLKDAFAVARQWISIEHIELAHLAELDVDGVRILDAVRHGNKIKLGHLRGNRFEIVVRGTDSDAVDAVRTNLEHLGRTGVANWFGEQRFGQGGANLDKGLSILHGNPRRAARRMPKRLLRLIVSAVQSEVFNRVLARRLGEIGRLEDGDVAWLHRNGACFLVDDAVNDRVRCARFELSPSGPLPGPRMLRASGRVGRIEDEELAALDLTPEVFGAVPGGAVPGARRPLRVRVIEPRVEAVDGGLRLAFGLDKGSFATSLLRELLAGAPWFDDQPSLRPPAGGASDGGTDGAGAGGTTS